MGQFQSTEVCTTPACIQTAAHLLGNLAPHWKDMDPCTNFDEMVCYGFNQRQDDPMNGLAMAHKPNYRLLREIVSRPYHEAKHVKPYTLNRRDNADEHNFEMLRQSYAACMDSKAIAKAGVKPLKDALNEFHKHWPIEVEFTDELFDEADDKAGLQAVSIALAQLNIRTWVGRDDPKGDLGRSHRKADAVDPKTQRFFIRIPQLSLPLEAIAGSSDNATVAELEAKIAGALSATFPVSIDENELKDISKDIVAFEAAMVAALWAESAEGASSAAEQDPQEVLKKTVVPFKDLGALAPVLGLDVMVKALVPQGHVPDAVRVEAPGVWPRIEKLVKQQRRIVLQSWFFWKFIDTMGEYVESPELEAVGAGGKAASNTYENCIRHLDSSLRWTLGHFFVQATYSNLTRSTSAKLASNIREEMKVHVDKLSWMSEATRKRTVKKLENMALNIGYPEEEPNAASPDSLAAFYSGLNITDSFFENAAAGLHHQVVTDMRGLLKPSSQKEWETVHTLIANAAYEGEVNSILIPAGVSQLPMFHPDLPEWALYGGLGAVIGHEITHSLDSRGRTKDENGIQTNWWDKKTEEEYTEREKCFVTQFSEFSVVGPDGKKYHGQGNVTLAESISDAGGLAVAYDAWVKERKSMPAVWDQNLPGLQDFTHEQLFFIMYGNWWCSAQSAAQKAASVQTNAQHPLNQFRILGSAENSRGFREAFKCPKKEPRCEIF
ncbi:hypothetical protein B0T21DRAFT_181103 [Apiosordaria backusii]|uniref:Endothelin-converting enzyme 1 n=1 Tax=Apiosordaria backusii TaxID=314023 RepID=A0AA40EHT9_9PEZI|nr:hypothetical protein B0T21DRAFT_181103 [Apiosordaria backusii]